MLPAGSTISGNHWAIHRDTDYYGSDVESFNIDRWLQDDGKTFNTDMRTFQYGFGRRVCPGQIVANNSVYITTAMLLWAFDIGKMRDASGKEIVIDTLNFSNTFNSHPSPFQASFKPRSPNLPIIAATRLG